MTGAYDDNRPLLGPTQSLCKECVQMQDKRRLKNCKFNPSKPRFCPKHSCPFETSPGIQCQIRKSKRERRCSEHTSTKTESAADLQVIAVVAHSIEFALSIIANKDTRGSGNNRNWTQSIGYGAFGLKVLDRVIRVQCLSINNAVLRDVCARCSVINEQLASGLETLVGASSQLAKYDSTIQGLYDVLTKEAVENIVHQLHGLRSMLEIMVHGEILGEDERSKLQAESAMEDNSRILIPSFSESPCIIPSDKEESTGIEVFEVMKDPVDHNPSNSHIEHEGKFAAKHPNWSWAWLPIQIILLFLAGLVVLALYTIERHDLGTATGLCALVWTVGGGAYSIYRKWQKRTRRQVEDIEKSAGDLA